MTTVNDFIANRLKEESKMMYNLFLDEYNKTQKPKYLIEYPSSIKDVNVLKRIMKEKTTVIELLDEFQERCDARGEVSGFASTYYYIPEFAKLVSHNVYKYRLDEDKDPNMIKKLEFWKFKVDESKRIVKIQDTKDDFLD